MEDGRLMAWGNNTANALGLGGQLGESQRVLLPTAVPGLPHVVDIGAGAMHGFAITRA